MEASNNSKEVSKKWKRAEERLLIDFNISPEQLHLIQAVKKLFIKYVTEQNLSETAAVALYYRLAFFSILLTVQTLHSMDMQLEDFHLDDVIRIFTESKRLLSEAGDCIVLEQSISSINDAIEALMHELK